MKARGWEILQRLRTGETLVFDGGYGTMLFAAGLGDGHCPELWNDTHADVVAGIHKGYFDAGSHIVETNTFGGARLKLDEYQIGDRTRELNVKGARLARSVAPEKFVAAVEEHAATIVGISALMTTTMPAMKRTIDALVKAGLRERVKVMVGGAPVSQAFADEIGADGYAKDSTLAVIKAKALMATTAGREGAPTANLKVSA